MNKEQLLSKKEQLLSKKEQIEKIAKIVLITGIFLYPFLCSFFGIDLGDTGIHMFNYENIYSNPDKVGFTCYLTNVLAWGWLQIFGGLGIWGLNLLEVIVEMVMAFAVYKVFHKYLGDLQTLFGILIAIMASDTYLNIFNYHQFNVFFLILTNGSSHLDALSRLMSIMQKKEAVERIRGCETEDELYEVLAELMGE